MYVARRVYLETMEFVKLHQPTMCGGVRGDVNNDIGWSYLPEKKVEQLSTHSGVSV